MSSIKKQVTLCTIGTVLEWYDFCLFSCLAPILSQIFFRQSNHFAALMYTFAIFASGYLMRPLGAVFFGYLGDKLGRKSTLLLTIFTMTIATTMIGLIPTGLSYSTVILVICRLIQGFSTSGEYPGGLTLLAEQNYQKRKTFIASFSIFGTGLGVFVGAFIYFLLLQLLGNDKMQNWGWRIPFLLGGPLGILGYILRKDIFESAEFHRLKQQGLITKNPILNLFRWEWKSLLAMLSISILTNALVYLNFMYCGNYLLSINKLNTNQVVYLNLLVTLVYSVSILFFGFLSDLINKKMILLSGCFFVACLIYPLFWIVLYGNVIEQLGAQIIISLLLGMILGPFSSILPEQFPAAVRYSGLSVTLNFAAAFFGSSTPLVCGWLTHSTNNTLSPAWYICVLAFLAIGGAIVAIDFSFSNTLDKKEYPQNQTF